LVITTFDSDVYASYNTVIRIEYQSPDRTLTDEEVDKAQGKILERLTKELGTTLRG
jgi:phenylalanyl-tRNA synthetase beta subunit